MKTPTEKAAEKHAKKHSMWLFPTVKDCFLAGAEFEKKQMIDKACEWLSVRYNEKGSLDPNDIEDFRKYMEE